MRNSNNLLPQRVESWKGINFSLCQFKKGHNRLTLTLKKRYRPNNAALATSGKNAASFLVIVSGLEPDSCNVKLIIRQSEFSTEWTVLKLRCVYVLYI